MPAERNPRTFLTARQVGTSPVERWYPASMVASSAALSTVSPTAGHLLAWPFFSQRGGTLDRIGCQVTALGSGSNVRMGIYNNTSDTNLYPSSLVSGSDGGSVSSASTGMKTNNITVVLSPMTLYWFAFNCSATAPTMRNIPVNDAWAILGADNALGTALGVGWDVSLAFGAMPDPFTASAAVSTATPVAVAVRYSA